MATKTNLDGAAAEATPTRAARRTEAPPAPQETAAEAREPMIEGRDSIEMEPSKRRMPDKLRRFLLRMQGGKVYLPAAYRIVWFRDELGDDWGIRTKLIEGGHEAGFATVHAEVVNPEGRVIASGMKTESKTDFPAGWVEKAESGSVARALALLGFGTQFTPELDDDGFRPADSPQGRPASASSASAMPAAAHRDEREARPAANGGARAASASVASAGEVWEGPGQCPRCHAPEGKRHGKPCIT